MIVRAVVGGPLATVGYLVFDRQGGTGAIIDAPLGTTKRFREAAGNLGVAVIYVINTHGHWDHIADNAALVKETGAMLCAHTWDTTRLANPWLATEDDPALPPGVMSSIRPSRPDRLVGDGEVLEIGDCKLEVLHTPGHTPGSICLYSADASALFTGDTLLRNGAGRTDFPGGNMQQMSRSLQRLSALPDSTVVYPGHGVSTSIREERWLLELMAEK